MENFGKACVTRKNADYMEKTTDTLLAILIEMGDGEFRPAEIAKYIVAHREENTNDWHRYFSRHEDGRGLTKYLHFLMDLDIVERIEKDGEPIEILEDKWTYETIDGKPMYVTIDGVEYLRTDKACDRKTGHWVKYPKKITPKLVYFKLKNA